MTVRKSSSSEMLSFSGRDTEPIGLRAPQYSLMMSHEGSTKFPSIFSHSGHLHDFFPVTFICNLSHYLPDTLPSSGFIYLFNFYLFNFSDKEISHPHHSRRGIAIAQEWSATVTNPWKVK